MESRDNCGVCGKPLVYGTEQVIRRCDFCGKDFPTLIYCPEGHYVCDACHSRGALDILREVLSKTKSTDPSEILELVMSHPAVPMHGPEHHFLVPAVLISAYCNLLKDPYKKTKIEIAKQRAEKVPGGFCGTHGNCGAGVGNGIFISVITKSTPLAKEEWSLSNQITGRSLLSIAEHGGPRCCKRDVYLSLTEAISFLKEKFNLTLESQEIVCQFSAFNKECLHEDCIFHSQFLS